MFSRQYIWSCAFATLLIHFPSSQAVAQTPQPASTPTTLSAEERKSLDEQRNRLWTDAHLLDANQKPEEALAKLDALLPITIQCVGARHDEVAQVLAYFAELQFALGKLDAAKETRAKILQMKTDLYGADRWQTKESKLALADCGAIAKLNEAQRKQWAVANTAMRRIPIHVAQQQGKEALDSATAAVDNYTAAAGADHWLTGSALYLQAQLFTALNQPEPAFKAFRRAAEIDEQKLGEHPTTGAVLNKLGEEYLTRTDPTAITVLDRAVKLNTKVSGPESPETQVSMNDLGVAYFNKKDFATGIAIHKKVLEMRDRLLGPDHPYTILSVSALAESYRATNDMIKAVPYYSRLLAYHEKTNGTESKETYRIVSNLGAGYYAAKDYDSALPLYERLADLHGKVADKPDKLAISNLICLGDIYRRKGNYRKALTVDQLAAADAEKTLGKDDPYTATVLGHVANMLATTGDFAGALAIKKRVLAIREKTAGPNSRETAIELHDIGSMYVQIEDLADAAPLLDRALKIAEKNSGPEGSDTAVMLDALAGMYWQKANFSTAKTYAQRSLNIREKHPDDAEALASAVHQLASTCKELGELPEALKLYRRALAMNEKLLGINHPETGILYHRVATCLPENSDDAFVLEEKAFAILDKTVGMEYPDTCKVANRLGLMYATKGDFPKSLDLLERSLQARQKSLGPDNSYTGASLIALLSVYVLQGDFAAALPLAEQRLRNARHVLENYAEIQSDVQQIVLQQLSHDALDAYIQTALKTNVDPEEVYAAVLIWKGATATRQRWLRAARESLKSNSAAENLYAQLETKSRSLASLYGAAVPANQRKEHDDNVNKLARELESLQSQLATVSREFRAARQATGCTPADLKRVLPPDAVLVDIVQHNCLNGVDTTARKWKTEFRLLAFIVRANQKVKIVDLGPSERVEKAGLLWRAANLPEQLQLFDKAAGAKLLADWRQELGQTDPAQKIREWIWEPLQSHVAGSSITLIAPDAGLAFFPWAAMPGRKSGTYLLEEQAIAVVPVPQLLPELLAPVKDEPKGPVAVSMLLVGDVHSKGDPGAPKQPALARAAQQSAEQRTAFGDMPQTRDEVQAIKTLFDSVYSREGFSLQLMGDQPTEQAFRDFAPKADYIHLAVHGFFDPARQSPGRTPLENENTDAKKNQRGAEGIHPDLYCGLAFVGSGSPPKPNRDDGILTAMELQSLNLDRAKLITLTSCKTAMGLQANGEGVLGIQRAFQIAGARSTLTALWSVPVGPTDALMVDFYDNLWKKKMNRAEALRQAQIKMLRSGGEQVAKWAGKPELANQPAPPYFWAAFVMAGDWRDAK